MFIVNQDRDVNLNLRNVKEISVNGKRISADGKVIGVYDTEERAKQVLSEMWDKFYEQGFYFMPEE